MTLCRKPLIFLTDVAGVAALGLILACLVFGVMLPVRSALAGRPEARKLIADLTDAHEAIVRRNRLLAEQVRTLSTTVEDLRATPAIGSGAFIEFLASSCREFGFELSALRPRPEETGDGYRYFDTELGVSGVFPHFPPLLRRIEAWSPFVQIRDLVIRGPVAPDLKDCQISWTVRVIIVSGDSQDTETAETP